MFWLRSSLSIASIGLLAVSLAQPAASPVPAREAEPARMPENVEDILSSQAIEPVETVECIRTSRIRNLSILDSSHLVVKLRRSRYLATMHRKCPMLRPNRPVAFNSDNSRLCVGDAVRPLIEHGLGAFDYGPPCGIRRMEPITAEQVALLRNVLVTP